MLESNYLRWRLEARQFLEHQFWKASACVGDLRPRKFSACVLGSECVCVCVCWNRGACQFWEQELWKATMFWWRLETFGRQIIFWWTLEAWQLEAEALESKALCWRLEA